MRRPTLPTLVFVLTSLSLPRCDAGSNAAADPCAAAAEAIAACTGGSETAGPTCDPESAREIADMSCEEIAAEEQAGKADGGWDDFLCQSVGVSARCAVERVIAGWSHTCALRTDGSVACFGYNGYGEVGSSESGAWIDSAQSIGSLTGARELALGASHTCAALASGEVVCWGRNRNGVLGAKPDGELHALPVNAWYLDQAAPLTAGDGFTCTLQGDRLSCWGGDYQPEFGDTGMVVVRGLDRVRHISALSKHVCVTREDDTVWCLGDPADGRLGHDGDGTTPQPVPGIDSVMKVSAGDGHTCALLGSGQVTCWGRNDHGQLGLGTTSEREAPGAQMLGVSDAVDVAAGGDFTCVVERSGEVLCAGSNAYGELGRDTGAVSSSAKLGEIVEVRASRVTVGRTHACVVARSGGVWCWGAVGNGSKEIKSPDKVDGLR